MTHRNLHAAENMNISKPAVTSPQGWLQNLCFIIWELFFSLRWSLLSSQTHLFFKWTTLTINHHKIILTEIFFSCLQFLFLCSVWIGLATIISHIYLSIFQSQKSYIWFGHRNHQSNEYPFNLLRPLKDKITEWFFLEFLLGTKKFFGFFMLIFIYFTNFFDTMVV